MRLCRAIKSHLGSGRGAACESTEVWASPAVLRDYLGLMMGLAEKDAEVVVADGR